MNIVFQSDMWRSFQMAECCRSVYDRGNYYVGRSFARIVHRGTSGPRHMSVGRFREQDLGKMGPTTDTPCYLPNTFIECERGDVLENMEATYQLWHQLVAEGYDTSRMYIRYSGNESFWITIPAELMGHPLGSVAEQKALRQRLFLSLAECPLDEHLWDARHLHRVLGSTHEAGGPVCTLPPDALTSPECFARSLPNGMGTKRPVPLHEACEALLSDAKKKCTCYIPPKHLIPREKHGGTLMRETDDGVARGQRNSVAFRRSCVYLREHPEREAWNELKRWNQKNDPPLYERELRSCFRSAKRTLEGAA